MTTAAPSIEPHLRQDLRKALERSFHAFETTDHHRHGGPDGRIPRSFPCRTSRGFRLNDARPCSRTSRTPAAAAGTGTTGAGAVIRCTPVRDVCLRRASPDERAQGRALQTALVSLKRLCRSKCQSISRVMSNCCGRSFPERVFTKMASFEQQPLMTGGRRCSTEERFFSAPPP